MIERFKVTGMSCAACSARVERAVSSLDGVELCSVNLLTGDMVVDGSVSRDDVVCAVINAGYGIIEDSKSNEIREEKESRAVTRALLTRLLVSLGLVAVIMYLSMGHMIGLSDPLTERPIVNAVLQMVIAAAVMIINYRFFVNGIRGALHLAPNMDTLVSLGSFASFGYSFVMLIVMINGVMSGLDGRHYLHEMYFESAAMILALITLGKMLEASAKGKTTSALRGLIELKGKYATLLIGSEERVVSVDDLKIGDVFVVRPGESVPTDGEVISGEGAIDESMLTGESVPRDVLCGHTVYGGSINKTGFITVRATKVGEGTVLAGIIKMVEEASSSKAPISKLADKVSAVFVPAVLCISFITFVGWLAAGEDVGFAIARAISVLVISCPCSLGLATPVAVMVGSGVGARRGVLFKTAAAIEQIGRVRTVVFDKTGTLTLGEPRVTDILPLGDKGEDCLISIAYSIEKKSEHPLALAIVHYAEEKAYSALEVVDFKSLIGRGVYGKIGESTIEGLSFAAASQVYSDQIPMHLGEKLAEEGKTPVAFILDGRYIGAIAVADTLKTDAKLSVDSLKAMGIEVVMLSGDNERTARAIANPLGIEKVIAGVLPDGKADVIRSLRSEGKVAMVGDGINDAPALTEADVGVAIGRGTDIAIDSADVVVMGEGAVEVAYAVGIGRATLKNIKENLFWAFFYNCIGIPLAAGLFGLTLSPMIGAAMMSMSSICVVGNALRLNLWKPNYKEEKLIMCEEKVVSTADDSENNKLDKEIKAMKVTVKVSGMMCPHCEARVKKVCEAIEGVVLAVPSYEEGTVLIEMTDDVTEKCIAAIINAGYEA